MSSIVTGRGLWYGHPHVFTLQEWDSVCQQAHAWGIQVLHPKVADAENPNILWYDPTTLIKLRDIAVNTYHLQVAPWMWCYGGPLVEREAQVARFVGDVFGSVILDIEDAWAGHDDWAQQFGFYLRQMGYAHQIYATVYANPEQHPTPIEVLNEWVTGFLPQVYFSEWTPNTASFAIDYFLPQWKRIEDSLKAKHQILKPILPIISLENGLPFAEVTNWLENMHDYGYCGFWYDGEYGLYAKTILDAPVPAFRTALSPKKDDMMATIDQNLNVNQLRFLWHMHSMDIPWNQNDPITQLWEVITQHHPEIDLGAPTGPVVSVHLEGQDADYQVFTYGKKIVHFKLKGTTCIY